MTPVLSQEMRDKYPSVELLLYRSIRGAWADTSQFDWNHINAHENMFCHSDSSVQDTSTRIQTIYDSFLMDGGDIVSASTPDATDHWINYYAVTASEQVYRYNYDGLFMDSAGHKLNSDELDDPMPWDYSSDMWRDNRYRDLSFVKSYLTDKLVIFNGLHSDNGADSSLTLTDGGMWEDFIYNCNTGEYKGTGNWWQAITCIQNNRNIAKLILAVKKPGLKTNDTARIFAVASYFLITNDNVLLTLSDYTFNNYIQYYPEYDISLGNPVSDFHMLSDSLFLRTFENGLVLVNPFTENTKTYELNRPYFKVTAIGGGIIDSAANYNGHLTYDSINGLISIPPVSALILKDTIETNTINKVNKNTFSFKLSPNPFIDELFIQFKLNKISNVSIDIYDLNGRKIKTLLKNKTLTANKYKYIWKTNVKKGNYLCVLSVDGRRTTKKILKLK
jgi:hypothetical protein